MLNFAIRFMSTIMAKRIIATFTHEELSSMTTLDDIRRMRAAKEETLFTLVGMGFAGSDAANTVERQIDLLDFILKTNKEASAR